MRSSVQDLLPLPPLLKHKTLGMIEYAAEDEEKVIKFLITDLTPTSLSDAIPGLPAHILFMCIRHADHMNDDRRMQSLLSNSINSIRKVVKVTTVSSLVYLCASVYLVGLLSRPVLYRSAPCRAVPCRAVPCRAVPCRALPCRAVLCCAYWCVSDTVP